MKTRAILTLLGGASLVAGLLLFTGHATAPTFRWLVGENGATPEVFGEVEAGATLRLEVTSDTPRHVYVFTHNPIVGLACLYPSDHLNTDLSKTVNGRAVLPGNHDGNTLEWPGPVAVGATDLVVITSDEPVAELETAIARMRQVTNRVFPQDNTIVLTLPRGTRPEDLLPRERWPEGILQDALAYRTSNGAMHPLKDHPGVWAAATAVVVRKPLDPQKELQDSFEALQPRPGK